MNAFLDKILFPIVVFFLTMPAASAQNDAYDVFVPISKYMSQGNAEKLSAWFADNLEITVISTSNDSSRNQARQILKYALGSLYAGGEVFTVTIFVSYSKSGYRIQQLKIERLR